MSGRKRLWIACGTAVFALGALVFSVNFDVFTIESPASRLHKARLLVIQHKHAEAEPILRELQRVDQTRDLASLLAAECADERGDAAQAFSNLQLVSNRNEQQWLKAQHFRAELLNYEFHRLGEAAAVYRAILARSPDDVVANEDLARLLGLCGLRDDAIPHVLKLIEHQKQTDLLMLLARETWGISDARRLLKAKAAAPTDPYPQLGQAWAAMAQQEFDAASKVLSEVEKLANLPSDFRGKLGTAYLKAGNHTALADWIRDFSVHDASADEWLVVAEIAEQNDDPETAIRGYWEALLKRPESLHATNRLSQLLSSTEESASSALKDRFTKLQHLRTEQRRCLVSSRDPAASDFVSLAKAYQRAGRIWESVAWLRVASNSAPLSADDMDLYRNLNSQLPKLPAVLTDPDFNVALRLDFSHIKLQPAFKPNIVSEPERNRRRIAFRKQNQDVGFGFRFLRGKGIQTHDMLGFNGGGIGIIDFDQDDYPDAYLSQGDHVTSSSSRARDQLMRNRRGIQWENVTITARLEGDTGFGQGVSVGDLDNDGFPDLYVGQTRRNVLLHNNGDGTFSDVTSNIDNQFPLWTTSCLVADLNEDGSPDLLDVNYLADSDVFERICKDQEGNRTQCVPFEFDGAIDTVWLSNDRGGYSLVPDLLEPPSAGKGLGVVAMTAPSAGLSLFIANDAVPNAFYQQNAQKDKRFTDVAISSGLAFNGQGRAEACMGVAAGDIDGNGLYDLLVTNFLYESNTLYAQTTSSVFEDRTDRYALHKDSLPVLGWGTQFLDANLDGQLELFIANGHTQDLQDEGIPYEMKPQIFTLQNDRFELVTDNQPGNWNNDPVAGRAVALLDWNRDGREDLCLGMLEAPTCLLTNESETGSDVGTTICLVATGSARDAIGTVIGVSTSQDVAYTVQLTGGSGFQCTNERHVVLRGAPPTVLHQLKIIWPSGQTQVAADVVPGNYVIAEGRPPLRLPSR